MIDQNNILDQVNFQVRRKGYDIEEVHTFIENLHKKYIEEALKVDNLGSVIDNMERIIKENLEEGYDADKSIIDIILDILLKNKKYRYQLEEKEKKLQDMEQKLTSFNNVQSKVMDILASAQEYRSKAEEEAKAIIEKAENEAKFLHMDVKRQAESRYEELSHKSKDIVAQAQKEIDLVREKIEGITQAYLQEAKKIETTVENIKEEYQRILQDQIEALRKERSFSGIDDMLDDLKGSIRNLKQLTAETFETPGKATEEADDAETEEVEGKQNGVSSDL